MLPQHGLEPWRCCCSLEVLGGGKTARVPCYELRFIFNDYRRVKDKRRANDYRKVHARVLTFHTFLYFSRFDHRIKKGVFGQKVSSVRKHYVSLGSTKEFSYGALPL